MTQGKCLRWVRMLLASQSGSEELTGVVGPSLKRSGLVLGRSLDGLLGVPAVGCREACSFEAAAGPDWE